MVLGPIYLESITSAEQRLLSIRQTLGKRKADMSHMTNQTNNKLSCSPGIPPRGAPDYSRIIYLCGIRVLSGGFHENIWLWSVVVKSHDTAHDDTP